MTVLAAYPPRHATAGVLELAAALARTRDEPLRIVTIVPPRWSSPAVARVDGEFAQWAQQQGDAAAQEAEGVLASLAPGLAVSTQRLDERSAASALVRAAETADASVIVVGSSEDAEPGRILLGSTADRIAHSARIPVAVAPRDYPGVPRGFSRLTCAVVDEADGEVVATAVSLAATAGIPLRLVTFAVRRDTMYPPEVGFDAEDDITAAVRSQAEEQFRTFREREVIGDDVRTEVGVGVGWQASIGSLTWRPDELLLIGSRPHSPIARVFLGSSATKIVRHSPVPVLLVPA